MKPSLRNIFTILLLVVLAGLSGCGSDKPSQTESFEQAPAFTLTAYDKKISLSLEQFAGKSVVVNFWSLT